MQAPLLPRQAFGRAVVDVGLQRGRHQHLGEGAGSVVGARIPALAARCHIQAPGGHDDRQTETVLPQQACKGAYTLQQGGIAIAGHVQPHFPAGSLILGVAPGGQGRLSPATSPAAGPLAVQLFFQGRLRGAGKIAQAGQQMRLALCQPGFRLVQRQEKLGAALARQAQQHAFGPGRGAVQQAFVDMADLLHIQAPEGQAHRFVTAGGLAVAQELQGLQHVQDHAVVHGQGPGRRIAPAAALRTAFQKGIGIGIEKRAAVGGQAQVLVADAAVDGAEQRQ